MKSDKQSKRISRILEGIFITVVGGLILFFITTNISRCSSEPGNGSEVKGIEALNGFVINDWYYSTDGLTKTYCPNEPQNDIRVTFPKNEILGWEVTLLLPEGGFGIILTDNYQDGIDFRASNGTFEFQAFMQEDQVQHVFSGTTTLDHSGTYEIELETYKQHILNEDNLADKSSDGEQPSANKVPEGDSSKNSLEKSNHTPLPSTTPPASVNDPDSGPTSNDNATVDGGKNTSDNPSMDYTPDDDPVSSVGGCMNFFDDGAGGYQPQEPPENDYPEHPEQDVVSGTVSAGF